MSINVFFRGKEAGVLVGVCVCIHSGRMSVLPLFSFYMLYVFSVFTQFSLLLRGTAVHLTCHLSSEGLRVTKYIYIICINVQ